MHRRLAHAVEQLGDVAGRLAWRHAGRRCLHPAFPLLLLALLLAGAALRLQHIADVPRGAAHGLVQRLGQPLVLRIIADLVVDRLGRHPSVLLFEQTPVR